MIVPPQNCKSTAGEREREKKRKGKEEEEEEASDESIFILLDALRPSF